MNTVPGKRGVPPSLLPDLTATVALAFGAVVCLAAWGYPELLARLGRVGAASLHSILETFYLAGTFTIFWIGWRPQHGGYRLPNLLLAGFFVPIMVLQSLDLFITAEVPLGIAGDAAASAQLYSEITRNLFPAALASMFLVPDGAALPRRLGLSLMMLAAAFTVPLVFVGVVLPHADMKALTGLLHTTGTLCGLVALAILLRRGRHRPGVAHFLRSILVATLGGLLLPVEASDTNLTDPTVLTYHVVGLAALIAALRGAYAEIVLARIEAISASRSSALAETERRQAIFRALSDAAIVVDSQLNISSVNPVAEHLLVDSAAHLQGMPLETAMAATMPEEVQALVADTAVCLTEGSAALPRMTPLFCAPEGIRLAFERSIAPILGPRGEVDGAVLILHEVTERWRLQEELRQSASYARNLIEATPDPIIVVERNGRVIDVNRATEFVSGLSRDRLIGLDFSVCFKDAQSAHDALQQSLTDGQVINRYLNFARPDGTCIEVSCNITRRSDADSGTGEAFIVAHDITDMRQIQLSLQFQADSDALTALPNRRQFRERLDKAIELAEQKGSLLACLLIDLDDFKDINDTSGHALGDELLKQVGARIGHCLRETDTLARIGGDEFAVLIEDLAGPDELRSVVRKLRETISAPMVLDPRREIAVTCSIGTSLYPADDRDGEALMRSADTAMYRAKEAGKDGWCPFTGDMRQAVQRRVDLGHHLRQAIERRELSVVYQPQMHLRSGRVVGAEALLRWQSPELGNISPVEFIPIAEDTGLILALGNWVLNEACRQAAAWARAGYEISIAVNLSARQFRDDSLFALIEGALVASGLPAHQLELELTESTIMRDAAKAAETMERLKQLGVRIAIDDFGTGYSSLSYLKRFPLDYLKIDRSFVLDTPIDPSDTAIVRSIVALSRSLGLKVIAEGVETLEQRAFLSQLDCDEIQGYLVSRPVPAPELLGFISRIPAELPQASSL